MSTFAADASIIKAQIGQRSRGGQRVAVCVGTAVEVAIPVVYRWELASTFSQVSDQPVVKAGCPLGRYRTSHHRAWQRSVRCSRCCGSISCHLRTMRDFHRIRLFTEFADGVVQTAATELPQVFHPLDQQRLTAHAGFGAAAVVGLEDAHCEAPVVGRPWSQRQGRSDDGAAVAAADDLTLSAELMPAIRLFANGR